MKAFKSYSSKYYKIYYNYIDIIDVPIRTEHNRIASYSTEFEIRYYPNKERLNWKTLTTQAYIIDLGTTIPSGYTWTTGRFTTASSYLLGSSHLYYPKGLVPYISSNNDYCHDFYNKD